MQIEKITRLVPVAEATYSSSDMTTVRKMAISLPRVRWLERDPDYRPTDVIDLESGATSTPAMRVAKYADKPLTLREKQISEMRFAGKTNQQVAAELQLSQEYIRHAYSMAMTKLRHQGGKK